eukprot:Gb_03834 [translate_table: standard]
MFEQEVEDNDSTNDPIAEEEESKGTEESNGVQEIITNPTQPQKMEKHCPTKKAGGKQDAKEEMFATVNPKAEEEAFLKANITEDDLLEMLDDVLDKIQDPNIKTILVGRNPHTLHR